MPLISPVGRKALSVRLLTGSIYAILIAGAGTMVYPFLLMVSGSFKTDVDKNDFDVFPAFVHDDTVLYRKHIECKYNNSITGYNTTNRAKAYEFRTIEAPERVHSKRVADWNEFTRGWRVPPGMYVLGYTRHGDRMRLWKHREFRALLMERTGGDIDEYNRRFDAQAESWVVIGTMTEWLTERRYQLIGTRLEDAFYEFKAAQPAWFRVYPSLDGKYVQEYLEAVYGREIDEYNRKHATDWASYRELALPRTAPAQTLTRQDWEKFVREELNLQFIRVKPEARPLFAKFLEKRYAGKLDVLNRRHGTTYASFDEVPYPDETLHASDRLVDWAEFVKTVPAEHIVLTSPELEWRDFLREKYAGDLAALNRAHEAEYRSIDCVPMPLREVDYVDFLRHKSAVRREFATCNYKQVFDYIVLHGRSLWNTTVYCLLAITLALTVNPLAAYALSRFKLPSTYKILLFCMATMAFPAAVTMIPNFLLLKQLGLLNTYAALVLPGMANGFSIFLLKGFFDSLPRELYECAQLDGAGEWTMFWQFSMMLSKPILAVLALNAFTGAYGNFMFAFILCPDQKMWTLMVFLYQLQINGHQAITFAALLIAAIPTFVVFVFCQNIIIRGIVVPVEK
ncbi:MAG: hypothetical protein AMS16_00910 [Planctomycetes bacterium DG_58]|nr:MAG: hypothetical protein AMS16_00910 [Planctomycetes bacterium DG_58]